MLWQFWCDGRLLKNEILNVKQDSRKGREEKEKMKLRNKAGTWIKFWTSFIDTHRHRKHEYCGKYFQYRREKYKNYHIDYDQFSS